MKVLQTGRPPAEWVLEQECTGRGNGGAGCGAILLLSYDDLFLTAEMAPMGRQVAVTCECPECSCYTDLEVKDFPPRWRLLQGEPPSHRVMSQQ